MSRTPPEPVLPNDEPLAVVRRGGTIESVHRGRVAYCSPSGEILEAIGDPEGFIHVRSAAKPFQALPLILSGAADAFGLTDEEISVTCASHNGEPRHLAVVRSLLEKAGLTEQDLQNGAHPPFYPPAAAELARRGEIPQSIHGNCSGKHAGMLAVCVHEGYDTATYRSPDHPLQKSILKLLAEACDVEEYDVLVSGDNCGVPTFALPLRGLATGFARLATGEGLSDEMGSAAIRIRDVMRDHPFLVAGTGRLDTEFMETTSLVTKIGAEAVLGAGSPDGWGMAIKISDGGDRALPTAARAALARRNPSSKAKPTILRGLHGETVGEINALL